MQQTVFIRLERTLEEAIAYRNSPIMTRFSFEGIHLLPNHPHNYRQRTYTRDGIQLDSPAVYICERCTGNRLQDISDYFAISDTYNDPNTGLPQLDWTLYNVDYDAGYRLVYLEIVQGVNEYYYSNPFILTRQNEQFSSRWDYGKYSIGLKAWFHNFVDPMEIETYDPISTGQRFNISSKLIYAEAWILGVCDLMLFRLFKQMFHYNRVIYCNLYRTSLYESPETPAPEASENFGEQLITLTRNEFGAPYNPEYVPPIPVPPVNPPSITLIEIGRVSSSQVSFTNFTYNGIFPVTFLYQYSLDGITWYSNAGDITAPTVITLGYGLNSFQNLYYRIKDGTTGIVSNVLQLPVRSITITNVTSGDGRFIPAGNKYQVFFTFNNYIPDDEVKVQVSVDGINWVAVNTNNTSNNSPKWAFVPASSIEFKYFRMVDSLNNIISNTFNFQF